ncbi:hypothetical protein L917_19031 [Phytophthora nicotianae]|uniref:Uncharacterized protein n=1 Tax=Phytophthora nicotianae TaxID=4792 RepID=W2K5S8_PHYNI|nr:hypothetical protein L917_19031 [Phytophthora nicotianae]ETM33688.1 hypothetical protein L914_19100 [Phytophthora nicotianae]
MATSLTSLANALCRNGEQKENGQRDEAGGHQD